MGTETQTEYLVKAYFNGEPVEIGEISSLDEITFEEITPDKLLKYYTIQDVHRAIINAFATCASRYKPQRILKSGNRTIVFWLDGTKTIVKRSGSESDDTYAAFTAALGIKLFGSNSALKKVINGKTEFQKTKDGEYV